MSLYSYFGQEPSPLPFRIRLESGETRTSLSELAQQELQDLGFSGPYFKPNIDVDSEKIEWINGEYKVTSLTEEEMLKIKEKNNLDELEKVDYSSFWNQFKNSFLYIKLFKSSSESLLANTICTEFISSIVDAKNGNAFPPSIQNYINIIFLNFQVTEEEREQISNIMSSTYLDKIYTLPVEEFLSSHMYYAPLNKVIKNKPYDSWTIIEETGDWVSPIGYPPFLTKEDIENKLKYYWDEDLYQSDNSKGWVLGPVESL
jgi:hypothetical protein